MQGDPPTKVSTPTGAVFLSYASQDAGVAQKICEALRAGGIEVWFDQSELRGGDAWDHKIRDQIHDCRLFIPVISANTERRDEGYFRREWSLAVDRTHDMAHKRTFLVPVVIDGTPERGATVPEKFHELQWTRLPGGETPPAFVDRMRRLLTPDPAPATTAAATSGPISPPSARRSPLPKAAIWGASAIAAIACAYFVADRFWLLKHTVPPAPPVTLSTRQTTPSAGAPAAFNPPPHSIAVLPFVNMSGDKQQEYFSDGLSEELLNDLARIDELHVAARTSAFSFKGKDADIGTIARKLNVGAVLEGSVRRSGHMIRVTAQLNNAVTGFHLWSQTYDRDLGDVLKLQTEIATAVVGALKVTLLGNTVTRIQAGGTQNSAAFDAYIRATKAYFDARSEKDLNSAIAQFSEAVRLDPAYALAIAGRSIALHEYASGYAKEAEIPSFAKRALADAQRATALAPDLAEAHLALAYFCEDMSLDFACARKQFALAQNLAPGNVRVLRNYGLYLTRIRQPEAGVALVQRAITLDPLNAKGHYALAIALRYSKRYEQSLAALQDAVALGEQTNPNLFMGLIYYSLGDFAKARSACEPASEDAVRRQYCLALTYAKLGRHADAEAMLGSLQALEGNAGAFGYAEIYAQWGDTAKALEWLEKALRLHDSDLASLKVDPLVDPLRNEPRFQAIERALKFPD